MSSGKKRLIQIQIHPSCARALADVASCIEDFYRRARRASQIGGISRNQFEPRTSHHFATSTRGWELHMYHAGHRATSNPTGEILVRPPRRPRGAIAALLSAVSIAFFACSDAPTGLQRRGPSGNLLEYSYSGGGLLADSTAWYRRSWVCSVGASGVYSVTVGGGSPTLHNVEDDLCVQLHYNTAGTPQLVAITWVDTLAATLDSIVPDSTHGGTRIRLATLTSGTGRTVTTTTSKGGILTFHMTGAGFPELPPDEVPDSLTDSTRILFASDSFGVPIYRGLAIVGFSPGSSTAARALAISTVGGTVVGGSRTEAAGYDYYVIQVPDSAGEGVANAITTLSADTAVRLALHFPSDPAGPTTYRRPNDGTGMSSANYVLDPASAYTGSATWGLGAVNAPFAWGCASGSGVKVAVIDMGLSANGEFSGRIDSDSRLHPPLAGQLGAHGQRVASVLGATANNNRGTAGIAYGAHLLLLDVAEYRPNGTPKYLMGRLKADYLTTLRSLERAVLGGARIISVSLGENVTGIPSAMKLRDWSRETMGYRDALGTTIAVNPGTTMPLLVISAGNNNAGGLGQWGGWGGLRANSETSGSTLLVTGGGTHVQDLAPGASGSGLIDLLAPGQDVAVFDSLGLFSPDSGDGSSYAAPFVAGAAALALEVNPALTTAELRSVLLSSASAARGHGTIPFLDAYATVKRAALGQDAALCGNHIWATTSNAIRVERASIGGTPSSQQIFAAGTGNDVANQLNVHRGGRWIDLAGAGVSLSLVGTIWQPATFTGVDTTEWSGGYKGSVLNQDQEGRFRSFVNSTWNDTAISFALIRRGLVSDSMETSSLSLTLSDSSASECHTEHQNVCVSFLPHGEREFIALDPLFFDPYGTSFPSDSNPYLSGEGIPHALDPLGRFIVVPVVVKKRVLELAEWTPCGYAPDNPDLRCRDVTRNEVVPVRTELVRIYFGNSTPQRLTTSNLSATDVLSLGINEDGSELSIEAGAVTVQAATGEILACSGERYDWLQLPGNGTTTSLAATVTMSGGGICERTRWRSLSDRRPTVGR